MIYRVSLWWIWGCRPWIKSHQYTKIFPVHLKILTDRCHFWVILLEFKKKRALALSTSWGLTIDKSLISQPQHCIKSHKLNHTIPKWLGLKLIRYFFFLIVRVYEWHCSPCSRPDITSSTWVGWYVQAKQINWASLQKSFLKFNRTIPMVLLAQVNKVIKADWWTKPPLLRLFHRDLFLTFRSTFWIYHYIFHDNWIIITHNLHWVESVYHWRGG